MPTDPMSPEEMRVRIAEACGWRWIPHPTTNIGGYWESGEKGESSYKRGDWGSRELAVGLPDFFEDLNACHEMEKTLTLHDSERNKPVTDRFGFIFHERLHAILCRDREAGKHWSTLPVHATAVQRAEAAYSTLNLTTPRQ